MKCFVISPIGEPGSDVRKHVNEVFKGIIEPALKPLGIEAVRSDHMQEPGRISDQMFKAILGYDLCVAILTYSNPNVYYELAVAQAASRPVIVLIEQGAVLPFDVKDLRVITYDLSITSYNDHTHINSLAAFVRAFQANGWKGDEFLKNYINAKDVESLDVAPFNVRIVSPLPDAEVDFVTVEGTFDKLPEDYELRSLRYYPDQHGFVPTGVVAIDYANKIWKVNNFDVGGVSGDARGIEIALAGSDARILLDYWKEAHEVVRQGIKKIQELGGGPVKWLPPIKRWPTDLVTCHRIEVKRK